MAPIACIAAACNELPTVLVAPVCLGSPPLSSTGNLAGPIPNDVLSVTPGRWLGAPAFTYEWCYVLPGFTLQAISGAMGGSSYIVQPGDVGYSGICCQVTGTNALGTATGASSATGTILGGPLVNVVTPSLNSSGNVYEPVPGDSISCDPGSWNNALGDFTYQWYYASGPAIIGATTSGYGIQTIDIGSAIYCQVTASNADGSATANSNPTGTVAPPPPSPPVNNTPPTILSSGNLNYPLPGDTLTVTNGTWTGWTGSATTFSYQWAHLFGEAVSSGGNDASYTLQESDVGSRIYCQVTGANSAGSNEADSDATEGQVNDPLAPANTSPPAILSNHEIDSPAVGDVLTVSESGTWTGDPPPAVSFQWFNSSNIEIVIGSGSQYTIQNSDSGYTIYCIATGTNVAGSAQASSNSTGTVV